jgi:hypothetical protein
MLEFKERLLRHVEHVKSVGPHCNTEETTKQALILPFLDILGFSPFDPTRVKAEYTADLPGLKANERVDYALFSDARPVMFVEAKPFIEKITNHTSQLARYFNATPGVTIAAISNGREWRFYTDLKQQNIMDPDPFLMVDFHELSDSAAEQLYHFRYDQFHPEALRTFAEDRILLSIFQDAIESCLREVDQDFVRLIAIRADLAPKLTVKFLESITPLVKQSVAAAMGKMVVSGLSTPPSSQAGNKSPQGALDEMEEDFVDAVNPKIVTTAAERKILYIVREIVSGLVDTDEIVGKDTESYYSVLYQGKVNRWILRYQGDKQRPAVQFIVELSEERKEAIRQAGLEIGTANGIIISKPEHLMKLSGLIFDSLTFCKDDENFRKKVSEPEATG